MKVTVKANNGTREGRWVAFSMVTILALATLLLPHHQTISTVSTSEEYQLLSTDLQQENLSLLGELKLAHEEIRDLQAQSKQWPDIAELQALWLSPFVQDQSWQRNGEHQWRHLGDGQYLGIKQAEGGVLSMFLDSHQLKPDIWLLSHPESLQTYSMMSVAQRVNAGWKQLLLTPAASLSHAQH